MSPHLSAASQIIMRSIIAEKLDLVEVYLNIKFNYSVIDDLTLNSACNDVESLILEIPSSSTLSSVAFTSLQIQALEILILVSLHITSHHNIVQSKL